MIAPSVTSRFLSIVLPDLAVERLARRRQASGTPLPDGVPFATVAPVRGALRLARLGVAARKAGLVEGQALAEARAVCPDLIVADAEPVLDARLLDATADWCRRYTPLVALDGPRALMLDIAGAAHLFGGEAALIGDVKQRLVAQGLTGRFAIAGTPGAARALAMFSAGGVFPSGEEAALLAPLPVEALGIEAAFAASLGRVGLKRIGDLDRRPRAPLVARFGTGLIDRLDAALGRLKHPIEPRLPAPAYVAERRFADPVADDETVKRVTRALCGAMASRLSAHGEGARRLALEFFRCDGGVTRLEVGFGRPTRETRIMERLIGERMAALPEGLEPGFGFDLMRLSVMEAAPLGEGAASLDATPDTDEALARLADTLAARFGSASVMRSEPVDTHCPEKAEHRRPVLDGLPGDSPGWRSFAVEEARPLALFERPEPVETIAAVPDGPPLRFRWRRVLHEVARSEGPERIAPEWWHGRSGQTTRDYFRVEDVEGRRFWLYRDGLYGHETASPRWYLHGLFA